MAQPIEELMDVSLLHQQARRIIENVIRFMRNEAYRAEFTSHGPEIPLANCRERVMAATGIAFPLYKSITPANPVPITSNSRRRKSLPRAAGVRPICCICNDKDARNRTISYHRFPSDVEMCKKWLKLCNFGEILDAVGFAAYLTLCSAHFKGDDFRQGFLNGRKFLKSFVLPSINLPTTNALDSNSNDVKNELLEVSDTIKLEEVMIKKEELDTDADELLIKDEVDFHIEKKIKLETVQD